MPESTLKGRRSREKWSKNKDASIKKVATISARKFSEGCQVLIQL